MRSANHLSPVAPRCVRAPRAGRGFTLVEVLVALFIVSVVFTMGMVILVGTAKFKNKTETLVEQSAAARMFIQQFAHDLAGAYRGSPDAAVLDKIAVGAFEDTDGSFKPRGFNEHQTNMWQDVIELKTATDMLPPNAALEEVGDFYYVRYYVGKLVMENGKLVDGVLCREVNPAGNPAAWKSLNDLSFGNYLPESEILRKVKSLRVNPLDFRGPDPFNPDVGFKAWTRYGRDGSGGILMSWDYVKDNPSFLRGYEIMLEMIDSSSLAPGGVQVFRYRVPVPAALEP